MNGMFYFNRQFAVRSVLCFEKVSAFSEIVYKIIMVSDL